MMEHRRQPKQSVLTYSLLLVLVGMHKQQQTVGDTTMLP